MDSHKSFCLTREPIISDLDFEHVSKVKYDSIKDYYYLLIKLTVDGFKSFKLLTQKLPDADLALVIEDKVAGVFENPERIINRIVPVLGGRNPAEMEWIYERINKEPLPDMKK